ncbi:fungal-specific transcription factor domain-containing protein [Aspergillus floccosus]
MPATERRQRVSVACTPCRKKKRRCDGRKPVCQVCDKEGRECEYTYHLEKRKPPTKCYIHALHSRIAFLEHQLATTRNITEGNVSSKFDWLVSKEDVTARNSETLEHPQPLPHASFCFSRLRVDFRLRGAYGLFPHENPIERDRSSSPGDISMSGNPLSGDSCLLSSGPQAKLLEDFWTWQNTWPVLVHEALFRKDLSQDGVDNYCTPTLLAAVLALSAQYTSDHQLQFWGTSSDILAKHAKGLVLAEIECPSLPLVLAAALLALRELAVDNLSSASQYIGISLRSALALGLHVGSPGKDDSDPGTKVLQEARSLAWLGTWMLEKHIAEILGHPSAVRECDTQPASVPIIPSVEYRPWPTPDIPTSELTYSCMSNFEYACNLMRMVSPVLDEICLSLQEKESRVSMSHVAMSEFYNNLPGPLRLPATATKQLSPPVYQLNLLYHTLKIMLHRPFIQAAPSMHGLQDSNSPQMVHIQSATFSAIRITSIVNTYKKFYPLETLSPFTVNSLTVSSLIHLFNANSTDTTLSQRTKHLYDLNIRFLNQMDATNKCSGRAIRALRSIEYNWGECVFTKFDSSEAPLGGSRGRFGDFASQPGTGSQAVPLEAVDIPENMDDMGDDFDWLRLPLNDQLIFDGVFEGSLWEEACERPPLMGEMESVRENGPVVPWSSEDMIGPTDLL